MSSEETAFVALGSNLGNRAGHLRRARESLGALPDTRIVAVSRIEETEPIGPAGQESYLNQMVALRTRLDPRELLHRCQAIEDSLGRVRRERWGSRTIDIDIVRFGDRRVEEPDLSIPHPELDNRDFWQREIRELQQVLGTGTA